MNMEIGVCIQNKKRINFNIFVKLSIFEEIEIKDEKVLKRL